MIKTFVIIVISLLNVVLTSSDRNHIFTLPCYSTSTLAVATSLFIHNSIDLNKTNNITKQILLNKTELPIIKKQAIKQIDGEPDLYMIITFVNGIYHSEDDVKEITDYIEDVFKCNVRSFYNPSSGNWVKDATKAGFELVLRPNDLELAKNLAEHLRETLKEVRSKGRILHIAHSGGAILTYLAVKYHLTYNEANRIDIVTLGGGRSLTHKYFKGRIYNYYSRNDPVLLVEKRASKLMRITKNDTYDIVRDAKHNTTFVFLEPIAKDPIFDHSMGGPTYRYALQLEAIEFQKRLQYMMNLAAKDKDIIRKIRKTVANITGYHHFWSDYITTSHTNIAITTRMIRKYASNITNMHGFFSRKTKNRQNSWNEKKILKAITHTGQVFNETHVITMNNITMLNQSISSTVDNKSNYRNSNGFDPMVMNKSNIINNITNNYNNNNTRINNSSTINLKSNTILTNNSLASTGNTTTYPNNLIKDNTMQSIIDKLQYIESR